MAIALAAAAAIWAVVAVHQDNVPLYTAATVMTGLREHPERWYGKTVAVRGIVRGSVADQGILKEILLEPFPTNMEPPSSDGPVSATNQPLTIMVQTTPRGSLQAFMQRIPILSGIMPGRQVVTDANGEGTYRITIADASSDPRCVTRPCYIATGLDPVSGMAVGGTGEQ